MSTDIDIVIFVSYAVAVNFYTCESELIIWLMFHCTV